MILSIKKSVRLIIHKLKIRILIPLGIYDRSILKGHLIPEWQQRIEDVVNCPDNDKIQRVKKAGQIERGKQFMHNGIPITVGGYYGSEIAQLLLRNHGVHEPQEEFAFDHVLSGMKDGALMMELGCYWAFYSIWFLKRVKSSRSILIEPDQFNIEYGKNNFRLNRLIGDFINAFIGKSSYRDANGHQFLSVQSIMKDKGIEFVDILHSDIQGYELEMLQSLSSQIENFKIGYFFISTHTDELHYDCLNLLMEAGYQIVCHADLNNSFSYDGLIVAKSPTYPGISKIDISLKGGNAGSLSTNEV